MKIRFNDWEKLIVSVLLGCVVGLLLYVLATAYVWGFDGIILYKEPIAPWVLLSNSCISTFIIFYTWVDNND